MKAIHNILVALDSGGRLEATRDALCGRGFEAVSHTYVSLKDFAAAICERQWDAVVCPDHYEGYSPFDLLAVFQSVKPAIPLVVISDRLAVEGAVALMKAGVADVVGQEDQMRLVTALRRAVAVRETRRHNENNMVNQSLAAAVFQSASEAIMVTDTENRIQAVNPAFSRITGYHPEDVIGRSGDFFRAAGQVLSVFNDRNLTLKEVGAWEGEVWERRKNAEIFPAWLSVTAIKNGDGNITEYVTILSDITKRKRDQERIWHQANFDALTCLANRSHFFERLPHALKLAAIEGRTMAVMFLDLDYFKVVNDTLGHAVGDALLVEAAKRMKTCVRDTDMVARIGGDEFAVMLSDASSRKAVQRVAIKLLQKLSHSFDLGDQNAYISGSIGISLFPDDGASAEVLLNKADHAMYEAKEKGRNSFRFYVKDMAKRPMEPSCVDKKISARLKTALDDRHNSLPAEYGDPIKDGLKFAKWVSGMMVTALFALVLAWALVLDNVFDDENNLDTIVIDGDGDLPGLDTASGPEEKNASPITRFDISIEDQKLSD